MVEAAPRYQLGPRSRRGLVAGWRGGQLAVVGIGLAIAIAVLRLIGAAAGAFVGLGILAVFVALATWPFGGRSADQWVPVVLAHARGRLGGRNKGALAALAVEEIPETTDGAAIGVIADTSAGTWTAAMRIGGSGFALGDEPERSRRIAAWSAVLASSAREGAGLYRLQWVARCLPATVDDTLPPAATADRGIATSSYLSLLERAAPLLWTHEVLVALTVRCGSRPRRRKAPDAARRLLDELGALERRCHAAGLEVERALSPSELSNVIRSASAAARAPEGLADAWPWPFAIEEAWSSLRTDGTWHAVYWIADWPRMGVGTGFMLPLMLEGSLRRTIAVTMAPLTPLRAVRRAEHDRTSVAADAELRQRHGFAITARTRHEHEATSRRETELAEGHSAFRFTGYLAVTAGDGEGLVTACSRLEQLAAQSQLEIHRMYGAQQAGYGCILPTGRGCT
jgi:hypothetical protein